MVRSGEHLLRKYSRAERQWGGDIGVLGSDINICHNGFVRERSGEGPYDIEEVVGIIDICSEGFYNWLEVSFYVH